MAKSNKPRIGTRMYYATEHFYYIPGQAAPEMEYCVCEGIVKDFFTGGFTEVILSGKNSNGYKTLTYFPLSQIGKKLFSTPAGAAAYAQALTEEYERRFSAFPGFKPLRRLWHNLLIK